MLQRNISGHTLTVMTDPPCEIEADGELEHDDPIAGFEAVDVSDVTLDKPVSHEAPDPSAGELPPAPEVAVPDEPEPVAEPVIEPVTEPAAAEPVTEPAPVEPTATPTPAPEPNTPAAPVWPAAPGGTVTSAG
ncbi:MAG: hypothetical protein NVS3B12_27710 [Acidimicrobiales bacterium]